MIKRNAGVFMKRTIFTVIIMFILVMFFVSCNQKSEIVDFVEPDESQSENLPEEKNTELISKEEKEPQISSFYRMKINGGEEIFEEDMLNLRKDEIE